MKKYLFIIAIALGVTVAATSCGGDKKTTEEAGSNETIEEVATEPEDETINGLLPRAEYLADVDGWKNVMTLYKDGSATSSLSGDCTWHLESIKDQPFVVVYLNENTGNYYIDQNQTLFVNSPNSKGYKLERVNYIPDEAKGMVIGRRYIMPKFRWGDDAFITLNEDGTVSSEFHGGELNLPKWKKTIVDGKEWIIIYYDRFMTSSDYVTGETVEKEENGGFIVSPSLEYYSLGYDDKNIKFLGGEVTLGDNWKNNRVGRLKE